MDAAKNHLAPGLAIRGSQGARDYQEDDCDFLILGDGGDGDGDGAGAGDSHGDGNTGAPGMLLVLADGMGGHVGGAVASKTAVANFIAAWQRDNGTGDGGDGDGDDACDGDGDDDGDGACDGDGDGDDIPARLTAALTVANDSLRDRVAADSSLTGMGCTLVGALITAGKLHWISIGDSPLWLLQGGELQRLNQDHSMAPLLQNLVDAGRMTAAEAAADPRRHALRAALMGDDLNLVDCAGVALPSHEPARVLLASDGVQTLSDGEIAAIMRDTPAADPCAARLLQAVEDKQHPRQDNTTVMVYDPPLSRHAGRQRNKERQRLYFSPIRHLPHRRHHRLIRYTIPSSPVKESPQSAAASIASPAPNPMPQTHRQALPQGYMLQEYQLGRVLGAGGFGLTYLGWDTALDKPVAVKEYLPSDLAVRAAEYSVVAKSGGDAENFRWGLNRFLDGARTLARFKHPNIVQVHRYFEAHGTAYIVMEFVEGETLNDYLKRAGKPKESFLREVVDALLDGLAEVHRAGFMHRDIKPGNIIITAVGAPVLVDFGAARQEVGGKSRSITRVVTPGYAPIEQYSTRGKQGPWTDIYALGAVAYRAITGAAPLDATERVRGDDMMPAVEAARGKYSAALLRAIDWALAVDEDQRPQNVEAWREALREDGRNQQPAAVESQAKATVKHEVKRKVKGKKASSWTRAAAVAGVLVLLAMVLDGLRQRSAEVTEVVWKYPQQEAETAQDAERQHAVGEKFRDCPNCPEMVVLPWGSFMMGSPASVASWHESPAHWALIARPFAVGVYEVTRGEYARFVAATGHSYGRSCHTYEEGERVERSDRNWRQPGFPQTDRHPAVCVNWYDAQAYIRWLSSEAGESYRLLSEAEWEYAARASTTTAYHFGENIASSQANNNGGWTVAVGSYPANRFGLHDVHGNVWEWTQDCWNAGYWGAPNDGSAWESGECSRRVLRGGSWYDSPRNLRSVSRTRVPSESRLNILGFRVARALTDDERVERPATMQNNRAAEAQRRREAQQAAAAVEELKRQQAQAKKELAELEAHKQREREQAAAAEQQRKEERRRAAAEDARREREAALAEQLRREEARKAEEQRMASELEELRRQQEQAKKELAELEARKQREREQAAAAEAKRKEEERKLLEAGKALQAVLAGLTPKCKTMSDDDDTPCWMEVDNLSGCYLWNANPLGRDSVEWSGQCKNGMVNGHGEAVFHAFFDDWASITGTGSFVNGKQHGKWVERAHFEVSEGRYMNGKRHGKWIMRSGDDVEESTYVDGRMHGEWVERSADGAVVEGQYMDDQRHGRWIYRLPDGDVLFAECYENDYVIDEDC